MFDPTLRPARRLGLFAVAMAVAAAACGTDDENGDAGETTATTAEALTTLAPATTDEPEATPVGTDATTAAPDTTTAPDTTAAPDTTPTTAAPASECRIVTDFDGADDALWVVVNDGVMGGLSEGSLEFGDSEIRFSGTVVTAGGGFTSIRRPIDGELAGATSLELRIRPDGREYGVTLRSNVAVGNRLVSYDGDIGAGPMEGDGYQVVTVDFADLEPTVFGTPVDAPPFAPDEATELGIIIADGVDGDFEVEIDWIDACR